MYWQDAIHTSRAQPRHHVSENSNSPHTNIVTPHPVVSPCPRATRSRPRRYSDTAEGNISASKIIREEKIEKKRKEKTARIVGAWRIYIDECI